MRCKKTNSKRVICPIQLTPHVLQLSFKYFLPPLLQAIISKLDQVSQKKLPDNEAAWTKKVERKYKNLPQENNEGVNKKYTSV